MEKIEISVTGNQAVVTCVQPLISGSVGQPVAFTFDEKWKDLEIVTLFRVGERVMQSLERDTVIPWELLRLPGCTLWAGAFGTDSRGTLQMPTVWVSLGQVRIGAEPSGEESAEATLPLWQQVYNALEEKANQAVEKAIPVMVEAVLAALPDGDEVSY